MKAYYNFMIDNAVIFGATRERAEKELLESLEFETRLANVRAIRRSFRSKTQYTMYFYLFHFRYLCRAKNVATHPHCTIHSQ